MALPRIIYPSVGVPSGSTSVASRRKGAAEPIGRLKNYIARLLFAAMLAVSSQAFATPTNLGFELGNLTGWTAQGDVAVVSSYTSALGFFNNGLSLTPPDIFPPPGEGSFFARLDNLHAICDFTDCGSNPPGTRTNAPVNTAVFSTGSLIGTRGAILSLDPITLLAGQKVPFNWRFLSGFESNTSAFNDFAVFDVVGPSSERIVLADLDTVFNTVGAFGDTGWHEMFWTAPANGTYNLRWVVSDGDNFNDVPSDERYPSTLLIDTVPEPSSFLLFGFGLVGFAWRFSGRNDSQQRATLSPC